jgi:hypothetical protein
MSNKREWEFDPPEGITDREVGLAAVLKKARYDLTAAQAKISEALKMVASLDLPAPGERVPCPACGARLVGAMTLAEHVYVSHDGPVPAHWVALDAKIADEEEAA